MIVVLTLCILCSVAFFGIIIKIYFIVKLKIWDVDLLNQGNTKVWKKLRSPPKVNFSCSSLWLLILSETQRKQRGNTFFGFKIFFPVFSCLSDILGHLLLTCRSKVIVIKIGSLLFLFIYYFPFSLSSTEWRKHNRHFIEHHGLKINNMQEKNHRSHPDKPSFFWILNYQISGHSQTLEKEGVSCKTWWNSWG